MFTGIVKEIGKVEKITRRGSSIVLGVACAAISAQAKLSDSIAVNGVCLTVSKKEKGILFFEAVTPTLVKTNLKDLKIGALANLEPALFGRGQKRGQLRGEGKRGRAQSGAHEHLTAIEGFHGILFKG